MMDVTSRERPAPDFASAMATEPADDWSPLMLAAADLAWREPPQMTDTLKGLLDFSKVYAGSGKVERPVLRWHGGKWLLAPWIISHFPPHQVYVEPFGGAASVLMRKARSAAEVYNDLDHDVVNLFRVLQDDAKATRLRELLILTPFAREEFELSYAPTDSDVEMARRLIVRSFMGFGSNAHATAKTGRAQTGFRANSNRSGTTPAQDWLNYPDYLVGTVERMRGVIIESRDALTVAASHDGEETLHYFDPPYQLELRNPGNPYDRKHMYRHELDREGHVALLEALKGLRGMVVLSGYPDPLYDNALPDWRRVERETMADGARPRTEVLWLNPACVAALDSQHPRLFDIAALDAVNTPPLGHDGHG
jgi:DNA adenine methylase